MITNRRKNVGMPKSRQRDPGLVTRGRSCQAVRRIYRGLDQRWAYRAFPVAT